MQGVPCKAVGASSTFRQFLLVSFSSCTIWIMLDQINNSIMHVIEWHYLPMIAFGIAGLWLGKKVLKW
ncbi:MAG: NrsF family protein [Gallionella sp.]